MSFANQALSVRYIVEHGKSLEKKVYAVPVEIDRRVAELKLASMGLADREAHAGAGQVPAQLADGNLEVGLGSARGRIWRRICAASIGKDLKLLSMRKMGETIPTTEDVKGFGYGSPLLVEYKLEGKTGLCRYLHHAGAAWLRPRPLLRPGRGY